MAFAATASWYKKGRLLTIFRRTSSQSIKSNTFEDLESEDLESGGFKVGAVTGDGGVPGGCDTGGGGDGGGVQQKI